MWLNIRRLTANVRKFKLKTKKPGWYRNASSYNPIEPPSGHRQTCLQIFPLPTSTLVVKVMVQTAVWKYQSLGLFILVRSLRTSPAPTWDASVLATDCNFCAPPTAPVLWTVALNKYRGTTTRYRNVSERQAFVTWGDSLVTPSVVTVTSHSPY
jgi:hypothetical protein